MPCTMRRMAVGALLGVAVFMTASPALAARYREVTVQAFPSGGVTIAWHGDRARGCADAGLCGYRGSTSIRPGGEGGADLSLVYSNGRFSGGFGDLRLSAAPVVRTQRVEESGERGACVDLAPASGLFLSVGAVRKGRAQVWFEGSGMSSGRCAGPDASPALTELPRHNVPSARLTRRGAAVDLSGRSTFVWGHFSGTIVSTVKLRIGRPERSDYFPPPHLVPSGQFVREARVHARYLVTGFRGKLSATFGGLEGPLCASLDACGVTGSVSWAILSAGGSMTIDGEALARSSDRGLHGAIAAIRRDGDFRADGTLRHAIGTTAAAVTRPDGAPCRDTTTVPSPGLTSFEGGRRRASLIFGGFEPDVELLRSGCPGPPGSDIIGHASPATGTVHPSILARREIELPLTGAGRFGGAGYSGAWRSHFALTLRRVGLRVSYRRVSEPR